MTPITVSVVVNAPLAVVWDSWTKPEHITQWNFASDDWEAPSAKNDLRVGGLFSCVMAAKDGSASFDFTGSYTRVDPHHRIEYSMSDGRTVQISFEQTPSGVRVTETFDPESENTPELQRQGWQAILDNYKRYTESLPQ